MSFAQNRLHLDQMNLPTGKKARLHRMLYEAGPANGTLMILPIDQGLEHGPRDFFDAPESANPEFQFRVAVDGRYSAIACQIGLAEKFYPSFAGKVPLVLKLNGKTELPADEAPLSPLNATVEDAVRLGADAVGYTLYVGSARQDEDFSQFQIVREEAARYGMPIIVWSYPRGSAVEAKGGKDSIYAIDYAARVAQELGADVIKLNVPKFDAERLAKGRSEYQRDWDMKKALQQVIASGGKSLVIFAGGEKGQGEAALAKAKACMDAGASGLIFGRNVWQRPYDEALSISQSIHEMLSGYAR